MIGEMTVTKVTVLRNKETGKNRIQVWTVICPDKRCEGESIDRCNWSGMFTHLVV
jgi:hypothetical protein